MNAITKSGFPTRDASLDAADGLAQARIIDRRRSVAERLKGRTDLFRPFRSHTAALGDCHIYDRITDSFSKGSEESIIIFILALLQLIQLDPPDEVLGERLCI